MELEDAECEKIKSQIADLSSDIDDLEEALAPLLKTSLAEVASKLPLLDQAKLHVLVTYAIGSILFASLKLNGVDAKNHPVYTELLARVKQYFAKINDVEAGDKKRENLSLDKPAAGRIIKHALAGNDKYDKQRGEQRGKEVANARKKFEDLSDQVGATQRLKGTDKKRKRDTEVNASGSGESTPAESASPAQPQSRDETQSEKTKRESNLHSPSKPSRKHRRDHRKDDPTRKLKSGKPPKSGSAVFQELLTRGSGDLESGQSKSKG